MGMYSVLERNGMRGGVSILDSLRNGWTLASGKNIGKREGEKVRME